MSINTDSIFLVASFFFLVPFLLHQTRHSSLINDHLEAIPEARRKEISVPVCEHFLFNDIPILNILPP